MEIKTGEKVARNVSVFTFLLAVSKLIVGLLTNSVALFADSIHSFGDVLPIFAAWVGLKISSRPKTKKFPYGYYKAESLASFLASIFILFLGYEIITRAIGVLNSVSKINYGIEGIIFIVSTIIVSYLLYRYQIFGAKKSNSQALMANAKETIGDVLASIGVLIGFACSIFGIKYIEGIVGILIAIFVFYEGVESTKDSILSLMDMSISKEKIKQIKEIIEKVPRVKKVENVIGVRTGPFAIVEAKIILPNLNLKQAENVKREVEKELNKISWIAHSNIIFEIKKNKKLIAIPVDENEKFSNVFGSSPYFLIFEKNGKKKLVKKLKNPGFGLKRKRGVKAALELINLGVDEIYVKNIGDDSKGILEKSGVKVVKKKSFKLQSTKT